MHSGAASGRAAVRGAPTHLGADVQVQHVEPGVVGKGLHQCCAALAQGEAKLGHGAAGGQRGDGPRADLRPAGGAGWGVGSGEWGLGGYVRPAGARLWQGGAWAAGELLAGWQGAPAAARGPTHALNGRCWHCPPFSPNARHKA